MTEDEQLVERLQAEIADHDKRWWRLAQAMERWGWSHCTTEKDMIKQIDHVLSELAKTHQQALDCTKNRLETDKEWRKINANLSAQLAEARAREGWAKASIEAMQTKAWDACEGWMEAAQQASAEQDEVEDRRCCRTSNQFKAIWDIACEALAAPAPEQQSNRFVKHPRAVSIWAEPTTSEAERRVVDAAMEWGKGTPYPSWQTALDKDLQEAVDALAAQQQESGG